MKSLLCLLVLSFLCQLTPAQEAEKATWPPKSTFDTIDKMLDQGFWQGGVIAWIDGEKSEIRPFGKKQVLADDKVTEETVFEIGSISKVFTTLLLMHAVDKQSLKLSDTLHQVLGKKYDLSKTVAAITLQELATHTSGLPRMPSNFSPKSNENPYIDYTRKELFAYLSKHKVNDALRGKCRYSNLGMGVLGVVLEESLGKPYPELINEHIATPLKMSTTSDKAIGGNVADGHSGVLKTSHWDFDCLAAAGDLVSNAPDMLQFARMCLGMSDKRLFKLVQSAQKPLTDAGPGMKVGLGWHTFTKDKQSVVWHNGGTGGFLSFFGFEPSTNRALFMVVNCNGPSCTDLGLATFVPGLPSGLNRLPTAAKLKLEDIKPCVGRYEMTGGVVLDVREAHGYLTVTIPGQSTFTLYPTAKNEFFVTVAAARCHFVPAKEGGMQALVWSQGGGNQRAKKIEDNPPIVKLKKEELSRLAGQYELKKGLVFDIKVEEDHLSAKLTGQPALAVYPVSKTKFIYKVLNASLVFDVKEQQVVSLTLFQAGRENPAKKIK